MRLRLESDHGEWEFVIPLDERVDEAVLQQFVSRPGRFSERFVSVLATRMPELMLDSLDSVHQLPTERQVRMAIEIARILNTPIPGEAFRYRQSMSDFISRHIGSIVSVR